MKEVKVDVSDLSQSPLLGGVTVWVCLMSQRTDSFLGGSEGGNLGHCTQTGQCGSSALSFSGPGSWQCVGETPGGIVPRISEGKRTRTGELSRRSIFNSPPRLSVKNTVEVVGEFYHVSTPKVILGTGPNTV